jgi:hypothetical protein
MCFDYHDYHLKSTMKIKDGSLWITGRTPHLTTLPFEPYPNLAVIANKKTRVIIPYHNR